MLVLAAANAVSVVLLGTVCLLRLTGRIGGPAFLGCLAILFVLATALWVRIERRHRPLDPWRRLLRVIVGLLLALVAVPMAVLTPLFWLDTQLPAEAGFQQTLGPLMAAILIALVLAVLVNAAGGIVIGVGATRGHRRAVPPAPRYPVNSPDP